MNENKKNYGIQNYCVSPRGSIRDAIRRIDSTRGGIALVADEGLRLLGTITDGDIRRAVLSSIDLDSPISILLKWKKGTRYEKPITGPHGKTPEEYLQILRQNSVMHLPIVDEHNCLTGVVRMDDYIPEKELPVQALLMAGGKGTRLYPLTKNTPKPMLTVGDKPLMETMISQLKHAGITRVSITTHYKKEVIEDHFKDGRDFGVQLSYITEEQPLGTAGAIGMMEKMKETLLILNGDVLTDLDYRAMLAYHKEHNADLTIAVRKYDVQVPYGVVESDGVIVSKVTEKPVFNFFVNAGIYLLEPANMEFVPIHGRRVDMTDLIDILLKKGKNVVSFPVLEKWIDIGQQADYEEAQSLIKDLKGFS